MKVKCTKCNSDIDISAERIYNLMSDDEKKVLEKNALKNALSKLGKAYGLGNVETQRKIAQLPNSIKARHNNMIAASGKHIAKTVLNRLGNRPRVGDSYKTSVSLVEVIDIVGDDEIILITNIKSGNVSKYRVHLDGENSTAENIPEEHL